MPMVSTELRRPLALTPREVADRLGVSRSFIYEEIARGHLPHVRLGVRRIVIELAELDRFLALRRYTAEQAARELRYRDW